MKCMNLRKTLGAIALIGGTMLAASAMAQSQGGYGMGPGMMGGYGQDQNYNMGPGMMGAYGPGYGRGQGYGMGAGMGRGYGPGSDIDLSAEQRSKIAKIQNDARHKQWELMGKMQDAQAQMNEQYYSDKRDDAALSKNYRKITELRHQMFDLSLSTRKQTDAVLTKEQRSQPTHRGYGMRWN
jgi:Spy/CpxP family protein refolding chaperone